MFGFGKKRKGKDDKDKPEAEAPSAPREESAEAPAPAESAEEQSAEAPATAEEQSAEAEKPVAATPTPAEADSPEAPSEPAPAPGTSTGQPGQGFFGRLKAGLSRTRSSLAQGLGDLLLGKRAIDDELLEDIETQLLSADVGIEATTAIIDELTRKVKRNQLADSEALYEELKRQLYELVEPCARPLEIPRDLNKPFVIMVVGVNGVGKTTTIGKLAKRFQNEGRDVMLAAGDTFRAAAVEQLQIWGERNDVPVVAQHHGADSASVVFDAYQAARARGIDVLIADTAGRLHTKSNLMQELQKVLRVLKKLDEDVPQEIILVLDATTGQNALSQASHFSEAVNISGLILTKLDGTAKGGMVFAIAKQLGLPLRFIGIGEKVEDLRPFEARPFVDALFALDEER